MRYDPKSANSLIADGEYDAEIAAADETTTKSSNKEMIKLTVRVWAGGGPRVVFDYVVNPDSLWRLKQIAGAIGKQELFEEGNMGASEIKGAALRVSIKTQKDKNGAFEDKNVIARYLPASAGAGHAAPAPPRGDDDIPF